VQYIVSMVLEVRESIYDGFRVMWCDIAIAELFVSTPGRHSDAAGGLVLPTIFFF